MISLDLFSKFTHLIKDDVSLSNIHDLIQDFTGLNKNDYYIIKNGKHLKESDDYKESVLHVVAKLPGGKGGFGSMLRAIGAQIEKTTNREACRDLSGRRLRDINEEKRLKTWIAQKIEREKQAEERRQKKLERLCEPPKHEFKDEIYEQERANLTEKIEDALEQGLKASTSSQGEKRKLPDPKIQAKKKRLWLDSDDELSSADSDDNDDDSDKPVEVNKSSQINSSSSESSNSLIEA